MRRISALLIFAVSCASPSGTEGADRAAAASAAVTRFRDETAKTGEAIGKAMAGLDELSRAISGDARTALDAFARSVAELDTQATAMSGAADSMRTATSAYMTAWENESKSLVNPDLRLRALDRRTEVKDALGKIDAVLKEAQPALLEQRTQLRDVRTYLSNDLTPRGLAVVKDVQAKARENGAKVRKLLTPVLEQASRVALDIAPARK